MSKELEALRQLHMAGAYVSESLRNKITPSKATELKNVLYHAIKRNEPMKVDLTVGIWDPIWKETIWFVCPKCHGLRVGYEDEYCYNCGQKLDWSDKK